MEYPKLDAWISQESIPFSLDAPETFDAAVDTVNASLGGEVEVLGFGEALHGGEDILILRNRLFRRLAEAHGYCAIAVESSFPRARAVNEFVEGRGPASYAEVRDNGFSHGFGALEANRELVEWMRGYNADPAHAVKLRFYGFDSPTEMMYSDSPRRILQFVLDYFASIDPAAAGEYRRRIDPLLGEDAAWETTDAAMDPSKSVGLTPEAAALRVETEDLLSELTVRRPELMGKGGSDRYREAVQYAREARQLLNYHAEAARNSSDRLVRLLGIRDAIMADNLAYIASRERGRGRVLAFAHNSHLKRGKVSWRLGPHLLSWWTAGAQLEAMLGPKYAVIGTAVGVSGANGIGAPESGALEARLTAAPGPIRFIPTHRGRGLPASEVAELPVRSGSVKNPSWFPLTPESLSDFDWLAVLDETGYSRGGPPLRG